MVQGSVVLPQKGSSLNLPSIPLSLQKEISPAPPTHSEHVLPPVPHPYIFPLMQENREEKELIYDPSHQAHPHSLCRKHLYLEYSRCIPHNSYDKLTQRDKTYNNEH